MEEEVSIYSLPEEIISLVLKNNSCQEIVRFSSTCKHFNEFVNTDQHLWKAKLKNLIPDAAMASVESDCHDGDWLEQVKIYYRAKKFVYSQLKKMSPAFYSKRTDILKDDVREFITFAMSSKISLAYSVYVLQYFVKKTSELADKYSCKKPFTLTEMHYARILLRHLLHPFITFKWAQRQLKGQLDPEHVLIFFLQWVDVDRMHTDEDFCEQVDILVEQVENILSDAKYSKIDLTKWKTLNLKEKCSQGLLSEKQVLAAISYVIYGLHGVQVTSNSYLETLNITQILKSKTGSVLAVACIYHAVAKRCDVSCDIVAFPNHFFLEWRDQNGQEYKIDLENGELKPKRRCPFSGAPTNRDNANVSRYSPEKLLEQILSSYLNPIGGGIHDSWNTQNCLRLLDLLNPSQCMENLKQTPLSFLRHELKSGNFPDLNINALDISHARALTALSHINNTVQIEPTDGCMYPQIMPKRRDSSVKYAVGMICSHKQHKYTGIVRAWDPHWAAEWKEHGEALNRLEFGHTQPFYYLIIANQSSRYVAQENITPVSIPPRLPHLEDLIAREFTHFNGYAYEPNDEKRMEYPDDMNVSDMFRKCAEKKYGEAALYQRNNEQ